MFTLDSFNNAEAVSVYLTRPSGEIVGCLDEYIDTKDASMVRGLNQQQELSFIISKKDNPWYEYLQSGMYLFVEKTGLFRMKQPTVSCNGIKETKTIHAVSCDCEFEDKTLNLEVNTGKETSLERNITFNALDQSEEVINPYTNIPYDWIVVYNTFPEQLTNHLNKYNSGYFGTPNSEITITDSEKLQELLALFNTIPRIKNSFTKTATQAGVTEYTIVEYVKITTEISSGGAIEEESESTSEEGLAGGDTQIGSNTSSENTYECASITLLTNYKSRIEYLINFYTRNRDKLSLLPIILKEVGNQWSIGDIYGISDNDYTIANMKRQFEISGNCYSFLTSDFAKTTECMVTFDILDRRVNVTPISAIGENTGITLSYDNLLNTLDISPTEENIVTRLYVKGANDLTISQVNFGREYIDDLSYYMNAVDENGNRIYVSDALATKYASYLADCEGLRAEYIQLLKTNTELQSKISELKYRVPNDDLKTDWGTFSQDELKSSLTAYNNLLTSLISLYRIDYFPQGFNQDDSINETFLKTTIYWQDYVAYNGIIKEIECALATFPYYSDHDKWSEENKTLYESSIKAWETKWELYGIIELQAKIDKYKSDMDLLAQSSVIRTAPNEDTIKTWSNLTTNEKVQFGNMSEKYLYNIYNDYYTNMTSAKTALEGLKTQISNYEATIATNKTRISEILTAVSFESNFTDSEINTIQLMIRDSDYSNDNIFTTNISTVEEETETRLNLLEKGRDELSIVARPQLTFSVSADNLLALKDYASYWGDFNVGNYILVQYRDNTFIKLRMVGYKYNPFLPSSADFAITFSNYIRSRIELTDLEYLLGLSSGVSSRSSESSGSGSNNYGESDDIDVTISNTMLARLLSTESFGTKVKDVILDTISANYINAQSATFKGLYDGTTTIDGGCIRTGSIQSNNYDAEQNTGSTLNLNDGTFSYAGGKLKYENGVLSLNGTITASSGEIGGWSITEDAIEKSISNSESIIPYTMRTLITSSKCRLISYVKTNTVGSNKRYSIACVGQTSDQNLNTGSIPRISVETYIQTRDENDNHIYTDGYNISGDELIRIHHDYVNHTSLTIYREYESSLNGVTTINKEYNRKAYYILNEGATISLGSSQALNINSGVVSLNGGAKVPTRTSGDNSLFAANTAYVKTEAENIFDSKIKFIDTEVTIDPSVSIASGSVEIVTADFSSSVPNGYKIRCAIWLNATSYGYLAPTAVNVLNNTSVKLRVRNFDTSSRTLSNINMTLICVPV